MSKINLTVGKISTWVAGVLLLFGVFGDWYAFGDEGMTLFSYWDADQDSAFILGVLAILVFIANVAVVVFDYVGEKLFAKYGSIGIGAVSILTFIIALASKEEEIDMGYGLILLLIGGIIMAVSTFIDEKLGAKANISFNMSAGNNGTAKKFCPNCGAEVSADSPFCGSCGNRIN